MNAVELIEKIKASKANSAWARGVKLYALELIEPVQDYDPAYEYHKNPALEKTLLNGAQNWHEFSWGGAALCYDNEIAQRLCAPWEIKKCDGGNKKPNAREEWLDVQERALSQAYHLIRNCLS